MAHSKVCFSQPHVKAVKMTAACLLLAASLPCHDTISLHSNTRLYMPTVYACSYTHNTHRLTEKIIKLYKKGFFLSALATDRHCHYVADDNQSQIN